MSGSTNRQDLLNSIVFHAVELAKLLYQADADTVREATYITHSRLTRLFSGFETDATDLEQLEKLATSEDYENVPDEIRHIVYIHHLMFLLISHIRARLLTDIAHNPTLLKIALITSAAQTLGHACGIVRDLIVEQAREIAQIDTTPIHNTIQNVENAILIYTMTETCRHLYKALDNIHNAVNELEKYENTIIKLAKGTTWKKEGNKKQ